MYADFQIVTAGVWMSHSRDAVARRNVCGYWYIHRNREISAVAKTLYQAIALDAK